MNMRFFTKSVISAATALLAVGAMADGFTPEPGTVYDARGNIKEKKGSYVLTRVNLDVKEDTSKVHLINTNNDPMIITKTYILKHADPYELRPYLRAAVFTERITGGNKQTGGVPKVECIKFIDGTGAMIVSAEDYRFRPQKFGMGIDEIIDTLDQPDFTSSSGTKTYAYFPKYYDCTTLARIIAENGMNTANDPKELQSGKDKVAADVQLNALLFYTPQYSKDNILEMLKLYDTPTSEVEMTYTIYDIDSEKDNKVGADFQAWKNGPGSDIFSTAGRFGYGWTGSVSSGILDGTKHGTEKFVKFSPRWNTRYLDFLSAQGKAKVITSGSLSVMNETTGIIRNMTTIPRFADGPNIADLQVMADYMIVTTDDVTGEQFWPAGTQPNAGNRNHYRITAYDHGGGLITVTPFEGSITVFRYNMSGVMTYDLRIKEGTGSILDEGVGGISHIKCYNFVIERNVRAREVAGVDPTDGGGTGQAVYADSFRWVPLTNWQTDRRMTVFRDNEQQTAGQAYGFNLTVTPSVCEQATIMDIAMTNTSLVGFADNGSARTTRSEVKTRVQIGNQGQRFVIGGLEKKELVRSVAKVPWLGSIPIMGWLLGTESESTKKSQIVAVLECKLIDPNTRIADGIVNDVNTKVIDRTRRAGITNNFTDSNLGFDQFLFDSDKKNWDPVP